MLNLNDPDWGFMRDPAWANPGPLRVREWTRAINVADGISQHCDVSCTYRMLLTNPLDTAVTSHEVLIAGDPELGERQIDVTASLDGTTTFKPAVVRFKRFNYTAVIEFPNEGLSAGADVWLNIAWTWPHCANVGGGTWIHTLRSLLVGGTFELVLRHPVEVAQAFDVWVTDDAGTFRRSIDDVSSVELDGYQVTRVVGTKTAESEVQLRTATEPIAPPSELDENLALRRRVSRLHEQAIHAIRHIGTLMQQFPASYSELMEPVLRSHVVTALDTKFEGLVTGETISGAGKTDIMIRHGSATILIVECKWWKGPQSLEDAIDQVLSYAALHQSRLAVLMFVTSHRPSEIRQKAHSVIEARPDFLSWESKLRDDHPRAILRRLPDDHETVQLAVIFVFFT